MISTLPQLRLNRSVWLSLQGCKQLACYKCKCVVSASTYPNLDLLIEKWSEKELQKSRVSSKAVLSAGACDVLRCFFDRPLANPAQRQLRQQAEDQGSVASKGPSLLCEHGLTLIYAIANDASVPLRRGADGEAVPDRENWIKRGTQRLEQGKRGRFTYDTIMIRGEHREHLALYLQAEVYSSIGTSSTRRAMPWKWADLQSKWFKHFRTDIIAAHDDVVKFETTLTNDGFMTLLIRSDLTPTLKRWASQLEAKAAPLHDGAIKLEPGEQLTALMAALPQLTNESAAAKGSESTKAAKIAASNKRHKGKEQGEHEHRMAILLMCEAWTAVREATDSLTRRRVADAFVQLPSADDYPDYFELIKNPMDLRSVKEKVDEGSYSGWDAFERDMLLIFDNAKTYNVEGSDVYEDAAALEKIFREAILPAIRPAGLSPPDPPQVKTEQTQQSGNDTEMTSMLANLAEPSLQSKTATQLQFTQVGSAALPGEDTDGAL